MYANDPGIWVRGSDKDLRHGGDQVLVGTATDLVDLVGGIVEHLVQLAQFFAGGIVQNGTALQLGIEVLALGQLGVGAADGDRFALQRQGIVHSGDAGQGQQDGGFMDPGGDDLHGLTADIEGLERGDELRVEAGGVHLDLAADTVGVDNSADGNEIGTHGGPPPCQNISFSWDSVKCSWKRSI